LEVKTAVIRSEAIAKFPKQSHISDLCGYFIEEMTPVLRDAVKCGTMEAHQALGDTPEMETGMSGLVHQLLVYNCKHDDQRYRFWKEIKKSAKWLEFEKAIAEAEDQWRSSRKSLSSSTTAPAEIAEAQQSKPREQTQTAESSIPESPTGVEHDREIVAPTVEEHRRKVRGESHFTKAVRKALINAPTARGIEICRSVDEDAVKPMKRMKNRSYEDTYKDDPKPRKQLDSRFAKIKKKMKSQGLLP